MRIFIIHFTYYFLFNNSVSFSLKAIKFYHIRNNYKKKHSNPLKFKRVRVSKFQHFASLYTIKDSIVYVLTNLYRPQFLISCFSTFFRILFKKFTHIYAIYSAYYCSQSKLLRIFNSQYIYQFCNCNITSTIMQIISTVAP